MKSVIERIGTARLGEKVRKALEDGFDKTDKQDRCILVLLIAQNISILLLAITTVLIRARK